MSIRVLKTSDSRPVDIHLNSGGLAIVVVFNDSQRFFVLDEPTERDFLKIKEFGMVQSVRAIGFKEVFERLQDSLGQNVEFDKFVEIEEQTKVFFYPQSQKLRILKDSNLRSKKASVAELPSRKKRVLVVDDSKTIQKLLCKIIAKSEKLEVVGVANSAEEAQGFITNNEKLDLITLDIHMPGMNGVEFLKSFLGKQGIPTVMISSVSINEGPLVLEALASGAQTYIQKPSVEKISELAPDILEKLESISEVKACEEKFISSGPQKVLNGFSHFDGLIAIGSSTGGTQALQDIFTCLPSRIPPIVVVQHIPAVFSKAFAERLNSLCPFTVKEAEDGEFIQDNHIYIAPGGKQMRLLKRGQEIRVEINDDPPMNRFKPSVDYTFNTIPRLEVENLLGVILTGMGRDGAKGLLTLKDHGAMTITQDEESSVVYGMPKAAFEIGASCKVTSLNMMALDIVAEFNRMKKAESA